MALQRLWVYSCLILIRTPFLRYGRGSSLRSVSPGMQRARILSSAVTILLMLSSVMALEGAVGASTVAAGTRPAVSNQQVCGPVPAGQVRCFAIRHQVAFNPDTASPSGYSPDQLEQAYNAAVGSGSGQLVAVVEVYSDPTLVSDLATYRSQYGLPACGTSNGCLTIENQTGGSALPTASSSWATEAATDTEMVSAACPLCRILVVDSSSDQIANVFTSIQTAVAAGATEVSLSFGNNEFSGETAYDSVFNNPNVVFTAAGGDSGYSAGVQYPAASPYVVAVGGTTLTPASNSRGWAETAWSGNQGGCSQYEGKPSWQVALGSQDSACPNRTVMDTAADANPNTGVAVYDSYGSGGWTVVGGTSVAAPLVAGLYADQGGSHGYVGAQQLYSGAFLMTPVTSGPGGITCSPSYYCEAQAGYNCPTGMGSPYGTGVPQLVALGASQPAAQVSVSWSNPLGGVVSLWWSGGGQGWTLWTETSSNTATFIGAPGGTYSLAVQQGTGSYLGPVASSGAQTFTIAASAPPAAPAMYGVGGDGTLYPAGSAAMPTTALWSWNIVRGIAVMPGGQGGFVLDGYGGVHPIGNAPAPAGVTTSWPGFDIARGIALAPNGTSGYILDGWGGVHPFGGAPSVEVTGYWPGWDIAVAMALCPNGDSGYVLDGFGQLHPFGVPGSIPPMMPQNFYWNGYDIARGLVLVNNCTGAYVVDGWGGIHAAGTAIQETGTAYWPGLDVARGIVLVPGSSSSGYVVDSWGNFHPFGGAPVVATPNSTPMAGVTAASAAT